MVLDLSEGTALDASVGYPFWDRRQDYAQWAIFQLTLAPSHCGDQDIGDRTSSTVHDEDKDALGTGAASSTQEQRLFVLFYLSFGSLSTICLVWVASYLVPSGSHCR